MSFALFARKLKEVRRDALVSHYLSTHDFTGVFEGRINSADDLYEYLLLDTRVSDSVTTTRLSSAVSSLQLYIHRALEGLDGPLSDSADQWFQSEGILDNWDTYNKRYSTWSGKEKLRFYAGNYIDPTLRTGKTKLFSELENTLNQGRLTNTLVEKALATYLAGYDRLARISPRHVWGQNDDSTLYLTGYGDGKHYWRSILRNDDGQPIFWGEWQELPAGIPEDSPANLVMMGWNNEDGGLECAWYTVEQSQAFNPALAPDKQVTTNQQILHTWRLGCDGVWTKADDAQFGGGSLLTTVHALWALEYGQYSSLQKTGMRTRLSFWPKPHVKSTHYENYNNNITITGKNHNAIVDIPRWVAIYNYPDCTQDKPSTAEHDINLNIQLGIVRSDDDGIMWNPVYPHFGHVANNSVTSVWDTKTTFTIQSPPRSCNLGVTVLQYGVGALLEYALQENIADSGNWSFNGEVIGDAFSGYNGLWLWEIFFHIPFLIADRLTTEQNFEEAERWYKYIFNSAGYRDKNNGRLWLKDNASETVRYWNCYPLQNDPDWGGYQDMPHSTDPDIIAMVDPMHYKLAVFLHTVNLLIARGDAAYRLAERDTLTEAQMYYVQAQNLLGSRPDIPLDLNWPDPTLAQETDDIAFPETRTNAPLTFTHWLRKGDSSGQGDGHFLPPYNDALLACYDRLDIRLFNLRNNLSLDGQPLSLTLYATPVDPAELHRQQKGGNGITAVAGQGAVGNGWGWRYPRLAEAARGAISLLTQFGSTLLSALERRDSEQMTLLLQVQQITVLGLQQDIARKNLDSLNASLVAAQHSLTGVRRRKVHYQTLIREGLSLEESASLGLRTASMGLNTAAGVMSLIGGGLEAVPNTFGLACGGGNFGGPVKGAATVMYTTASVLEQSAALVDISGNYKRRAQEWSLQYEMADNEEKQLSAQVDSLLAQQEMQYKQIVLTETEHAFSQAVYELQRKRFTGQELYNWMAGRLSALYFQMYDATVPVCLQAVNALQKELGGTQGKGLFRAGAWNNLYQGLLAGEFLSLELQKLDNVWLEHGAQGLEAVRTISLAELRNESSGSLTEVIATLLKGEVDSVSVKNNVSLSINTTTGIFSAVLQLPDLKLSTTYNMNDKTCFIKNVSVTLPGLLGPYQDIEATLAGHDRTVTLSHCMQDNGRFIPAADDGRLQPFEGLNPDNAALTLNIFKACKNESQRPFVESLSDIIFQIQYILR